MKMCATCGVNKSSDEFYARCWSCKECMKAYDKARRDRKRAEMIERLQDAYGPGCMVCGTLNDLEIDHVIPRASDGPDDFDNYQLLCTRHNAIKRDRRDSSYDYRPAKEMPRDPKSLRKSLA